eukprot:2317154-Amphidinium_carterae.1
MEVRSLATLQFNAMRGVETHLAFATRVTRNKVPQVESTKTCGCDRCQWVTTKRQKNVREDRVRELTVLCILPCLDQLSGHARDYGSAHLCR